jgi:sugar lactone lactonase YvrE
VTTVDVARDARAELGEGPLWDDRRGVLWWVDIMAGHVHRFDPRTGHDEVFEVGQPVGTVGLRVADEQLVLAVRDGFALLDPATRAVRPLALVEIDQPGNRMNDGYCDARGRFWAGTMAMDERSRGGGLYRLDPSGQVTRMLDGVGISNGINWSLDGRTMYYVDTPTRRVDAFDFEPESGAIANRRALIELGSGEGFPDGLVVDAEGCLWIALWGGWRLQRHHPDGRLDRIVRLPAARVTKPAFAGPDLEDLYVTTAWRGATEAERAEQPHAGSLFHCRPGVSGRPPSRYG